MRSIFVTLTALLLATPLLAAEKAPEQRVAEGVTDADKINDFDCGTDSHDALELVHAHQTLEKRAFTLSPAVRRAEALAVLRRRQSPTIIPAYFHIVTTKAKASLVSDSMPQSQLAVLNQAYQGTGFQFKLQQVTRTQNDDWAVSRDARPMQQALRKGSYNALNIYFLSDLSGNVLGSCSLPTNVGSGKVDPSRFNQDGCLVHAGTMPNGTIRGYNLGMTAVHETGHWMGLLHTFEGNACSGNGDYISDTPTQATSTNGCPTGKDSCPSQAGLDSIHNYMDYSTDACYESFTAGQISRMQSLWKMYRNGK